MKRNRIVLISALSTLLLTSLALAAAQQPAVERRVVAAGGGRESEGTITIENTFGQPVVGSSSAGTLDLCAGFWCKTPGEASEPVVPVADLAAAPREGVVPLEVQFTDTSAYTPTAWLWAFGDGETSTLQNPTHLYTLPGSYTVTLTVSNDTGSDVATRPGYITVTPATRYRIYLPLVARNPIAP